jgi:phage repressor protein C with HTH and peptisase S24 domain
METPAARLRFLRERRDIGSAAEFARRLGVPEVTYRAHESGVRGFGETQARRYADALRANWVWLLTGTGDPFGGTPDPVIPSGDDAASTANNHSFTQNEKRAAAPGVADLPVYASAEGGPSGMMVTYDPVDWLVRPDALQNVRDAFAVYVIGESMEPRYEQGDMILVHPTKPPKRDDDVLLLSEQSDGAFAALVKRLVRWDSNSWTVRQYNPMKEYELPRATWQRAHAVLGRFNRR